MLRLDEGSDVSLAFFSFSLDDAIRVLTDNLLTNTTSLHASDRQRSADGKSDESQRLE